MAKFYSSNFEVEALEVSVYITGFSFALLMMAFLEAVIIRL
jgi:hypothetical protein